MNRLHHTLCIMTAAAALTLCQPAHAQKDLYAAAHEDTYYLEGAVPEENGKVVFAKEFSIPGMTRQEVYGKAMQWAEARMKENGNEISRVAYTQPDEGVIAAMGQEYIVFQSSAMSLDRTKLSYQMVITCDDNSCRLEFGKLRYEYPSTGEKFMAEESINDENALNRDHTKLVRGWAKFRRKTVDWVDGMNEELQKALSGELKSGTQQEATKTRDSNEVTVVRTSAQPAQVTAQATQPPVTASEKPATATPAAQADAPTGFRSIEPKDLTSDMVKVSNGRLVVMVNGNSITANAGGYLSHGQGGTTTISTILTPDQDFSALASAQTYVVNYYPNGSDAPTVIMVCRNITTEKPSADKANIFTGEVTSVQTTAQ